MTNIQAIDLLKGLEQSLDDYCELNDEGKTAFRMAITALELFGNSEQLPSAQPERKDTIEKDVAVEAISDELMSRFDISATYAYEVAEKAIYALFMLFIWAVMAGGSSLVMDASANVKFLALAIMLAGAMAGGDGK